MKLSGSILFGFITIIALTSSIEARTSCKQFNSQSQAQKYYDAKKKGYKSLDKDRDGEACECLVGGSGYGTSNCERWRKKNGK